jgi:hypothetical protein
VGVTSKPITGKKGRVMVMNLAIHLTDYRLRFYADDLPNRTFESVGPPDGDSYDEGDTGFKGCEISFKGRVNANQMPHDPVPNINEGARVAMKFFLDKRKPNTYAFDEVRVLSVEIASSAEGWATIDVTAKNNGGYTKATN